MTQSGDYQGLSIDGRPRGCLQQAKLGRRSARLPTPRSPIRSSRPRRPRRTTQRLAIRPADGQIAASSSICRPRSSWWLPSSTTGDRRPTAAAKVRRPVRVGAREKASADPCLSQAVDALRRRAPSPSWRRNGSPDRRGAAALLRGRFVANPAPPFDDRVGVAPSPLEQQRIPIAAAGSALQRDRNHEHGDRWSGSDVGSPLRGLDAGAGDLLRSVRAWEPSRGGARALAEHPVCWSVDTDRRGRTAGGGAADPTRPGVPPGPAAGRGLYRSLSRVAPAAGDLPTRFRGPGAPVAGGAE